MKIHTILAVAIAIFMLAACERLPGVVNEAKREVRRSLIDPSSAQFESVYQNSQTGAVCGLVNAKNRMGAYVGAIPFVYEPSSGVTLVPEPPTEREFERYFESIKYAEVEDYMALEDKCKAVALWQTKCGSSAYSRTNQYCVLINDGKSMMDVYRAAEPNLRRY